MQVEHQTNRQECQVTLPFEGEPDAAQEKWEDKGTVEKAEFNDLEPGEPNVWKNQRDGDQQVSLNILE